MRTAAPALAPNLAPRLGLAAALALSLAAAGCDAAQGGAPSERTFERVLKEQLKDAELCVINGGGWDADRPAEAAAIARLAERGVGRIEDNRGGFPRRAFVDAETGQGRICGGARIVDVKVVRFQAREMEGAGQAYVEAEFILGDKADWVADPAAQGFPYVAALNAPSIEGKARLDRFSDGWRINRTILGDLVRIEGAVRVTAPPEG